MHQNVLLALDMGVRKVERGWWTRFATRVEAPAQFWLRCGSGAFPLASRGSALALVTPGSTRSSFEVLPVMGCKPRQVPELGGVDSVPPSAVRRRDQGDRVT